MWRNGVAGDDDVSVYSYPKMNPKLEARVIFEWDVLSSLILPRCLWGCYVSLMATCSEQFCILSSCQLPNAELRRYQAEAKRAVTE